MANAEPEVKQPVKAELNNSTANDNGPQQNNQMEPQHEQQQPQKHQNQGQGGNQQFQHQNFGNRRGGPNNRFNNHRQGPFNPHNRGGGGGGGGGGGAGGNGEPFFKRRSGGPHQGPGGHYNQNDGRPSMDKIMNDKLAAISGPTFDLPPLDYTEKPFSSRTRLYIGNITNDLEEDDIKELFKPYGELGDFFMNKEKNFAFIKVDYRINAEKAKRELDGILFKGKNLRIRFAPIGSTIKVKNLSHFISNELLYAAFQIFGEVERAYVNVDERGKPTGEGIVDFARKGCALGAVRKCSEGCYFLTGSLVPCIVEMYEPIEDTDGYPEKSIPKKFPDYRKSREVGPRFADPSSFEFEYGMRWKQLHELYAQKEQALKIEYGMEKEKLEAQMEYARYEHETETLRDQLRAREMDRDRQKHEWERKKSFAEEQRQRNEDQMRRQQEDMQNRISHQDEEMRRRQQENTLFMQANQLDNMLEQQEQAFEAPGTFEPNADSNTPVVEPKAFLNSYKRNNQRFEGRGDMGPTGPRGGGGRGHWVNNDNRRDDFQHKRRRF